MSKADVTAVADSADGSASTPRLLHRFGIVPVLFAASGFAGLAYEVIWMRYLSLVLGNTVYASATVLCAFMAGLALGSILLGRLADHASRHLGLYGVLQLLIAAFGLAFPHILDAMEPGYVWLARRFTATPHAIDFVRVPTAILVLIFPSTLMGGTLPILTRYFCRSNQSVGRTLSILYAVNTGGAVLGCAVTGYLLIGAVGLFRANLLAAAISVAVGVTAIIAQQSTREPPAAEAEQDQAKASQFPIRLRWFLALFALSGCTALAYEVVWTRVLIFLIGNTTYAFTSVLTTYLAGLTIGSVLAKPILRRARNALQAFALCEVIIGLFSVITLLAIPLVLQRLNTALFSSSGELLRSHLFSFVALQAGLCGAVIFPMTLLFGIVYPVAVSVFCEANGMVGRDTGVAGFANTIGAVAGSLLAGFLLIPALGTLLSIETLAAVNILIGIIAFVYDGESAIGARLRRAVALTACCMAIFVLCVRQIPGDALSRLFVPSGANLAYIQEDVGGTVTVEDFGTYRTISINGVNVAGTDLMFETTQKLQAHLALLLHDDPRDVLQIGFGAGGTAWAITRHPVEKIDCVEITKAVIKANAQFRDVNHGVLEDQRVSVTIDDARTYLLTTDKTYDVILSDSVHPRRAGNGGLYSVDYFELCRKRLRPRGIFSAWLPVYGLSLEDFRVAVRSLRAVFPHVYLFHTPVGRNEWTIIIGVNEPLTMDFQRIASRLESPSINEDLAVIHMNRTEAIVATLLVGDKTLSGFLGKETILNTDDLPYLEYIAPRSTFRHSRQVLFASVYGEMLKYREDPLDYTEGGNETVAKTVASFEKLLVARSIEIEQGDLAPTAAAAIREALAIDPDNAVATDLLQIR